MMKKIVLAVLAILIVLIAPKAYYYYAEVSKAMSEDPRVWEEAIVEFEEDARANGYPENAVVFVGSSSIRLWTSLVKDMGPSPVIQRGFGGAKLADVDYYAERLVNAYKPAAVVVFAGTNDISEDMTYTPRQLADTYKSFVAKVRKDQNNVPIYYIGITPSVLKWNVWDKGQATNNLIRDFIEQDENHTFIDTSVALLEELGEPNPDNYADEFLWGGLHLNAKGYAIWTNVIKPYLMEYALQPDQTEVSELQVIQADAS